MDIKKAAKLDMGDRYRWAWEQSDCSSSEKLVLLAYVEHANQDLKSWPSVPRIVRITRLNRKTVLKAIDNLKVLKLISHTGERCGRTGQVNIYRINMFSSKLENITDTNVEEHSSTEAVSQFITVPNFPSKSPDYSGYNPNFTPKGTNIGTGNPFNPSIPIRTFNKETKENVESRSSIKKRLFVFQNKVSLPEDFHAIDEVKEWAESKGHSQLEERLEHFKNYAAAKGARYADWNAAFRNAISGDWAKLNYREARDKNVKSKAWYKPDSSYVSDALSEIKQIEGGDGHEKHRSIC